jgi:acyl carrier protein
MTELASSALHGPPRSPERSEILAAIQAAVMDILEDEAPVLSETSRLNEENTAIDSLDFIEIVMQLEERFGLVIDAQHLRAVETVAEVIDLVSRLRAEGPTSPA